MVQPGLTIATESIRTSADSALWRSFLASGSGAGGCRCSGSQRSSFCSWLSVCPAGSKPDGSIGRLGRTVLPVTDSPGEFDSVTRTTTLEEEEAAFEDLYR